MTSSGVVKPACALRTQDRGRDLFVDQLARLVVNDEDLEDAEATAIAGVGAVGTTFAFLEAGAGHAARVQAQGAQFRLCRHGGGRALTANFPDQPPGHSTSRGGSPP